MVLVSYVEVVSYVPITQIGLAVAATNRWIRFIAVAAHIFFSVIDWGHRRLQKEPQFFFHVRKKNMNYTRSVAKNGPFFMSGACAAHSLSML